MLKGSRLLRILDLIESQRIYTQQELAQRLQASGFKVTQATVCRDIKALGLVKTPSGFCTPTKIDGCHKPTPIPFGGILSVRAQGDKVFVRAGESCGIHAKQYLYSILGDDYAILCDNNSAIIFLSDRKQATQIVEQIKNSLLK